MPRMTEAERQTAQGDYNGHYEEVLLVHPGWEIFPGFGLTQLRNLEGTYNQKVADIQVIEDSGMPLKRAQRDALFGTSPTDNNGVWAYLKLYKGNVSIRLPKNSALRKTVPNLGVISPGAYDKILGLFEEHWKLVNDELPNNPLVLGPIDLAELQSRRAQIATLESQIDESTLTRLAVMRAQREAIFGDVREEERDDDSVVARLQAYAIQIATQFAGSPLAATIPRLFPDGGGESLPRFNFNFSQVATNVTVWWEAPADVAASVIYLKEGAFEETEPIPSAPPLKVVFGGVAVQDDVDELELRDENGKTVAHGKYDAQLIEPV